MLSKTMEKALNEQINKEMYSSYLYLAMAAHLSEQHLDGFGKFFEIQAQEEWGHAMKIYKHVNERGGRVVLEKIDKPQTTFKDLEEIFTLTLAHEQFITKSINSLVDLAVKEKDHASQIFLDWFVNEQVEEEANMENWLVKIRMSGAKGHVLFILDSHAGERKK
ncbi:MAG: Ferritin [bacterium ADurb.Bin478]|nr:MAG: Ferritin [bacterium ADurb.Bin478]